MLRAALVYDVEGWILHYIGESTAAILASSGVLAARAVQCPASPAAWRALVAECDVVHFLSPWNFFRWGAMLPRPLAVTVHHLTANTIEALGRQGAGIDALVYTNEICAGQLRTLLPGREPRLARYGLDTEEFAPRAGAREALCARLGIPAERVILGFSAKPSSDDGGRKATARYWESLAALGAAGIDAHLVVFGPGPETPGGWQEGMIPEALRPRVSLAGFITRAELPLVYTGLDFHLSLSTVEGGPYPVLETIACGVVNVATAVGIVPEVLRDGENGFVVSQEGFAVRLPGIIREVQENPARAQAIRDAARAAVMERHRWDRVVEPSDFLRLYDEARDVYTRRPAHERLRRRFRLLAGRSTP